LLLNQILNPEKRFRETASRRVATASLLRPALGRRLPLHLNIALVVQNCAFFYAVSCHTPALDASPWHGQSDQSSEAPESGLSPQSNVLKNNIAHTSQSCFLRMGLLAKNASYPRFADSARRAAPVIIYASPSKVAKMTTPGYCSGSLTFPLAFIGFAITPLTSGAIKEIHGKNRQNETVAQSS